MVLKHGGEAEYEAMLKVCVWTISFFQFFQPFSAAVGGVKRSHGSLFLGLFLFPFEFPIMFSVIFHPSVLCCCWLCDRATCKR